MILDIVNWLFPLILTIQRRNFLKKLSSILMLAFNLLITPSMSSNLASAVSASLIDKATLLSIFCNWSLCCRSRSSPRPMDLKSILSYYLTLNIPKAFQHIVSPIPNLKFKVLKNFWTNQKGLHSTGLVFFCSKFKNQLRLVPKFEKIRRSKFGIRHMMWWKAYLPLASLISVLNLAMDSCNPSTWLFISVT